MLLDIDMPGKSAASVDKYGWGQIVGHNEGSARFPSVAGRPGAREGVGVRVPPSVPQNMPPAKTLRLGQLP